MNSTSPTSGRRRPSATTSSSRAAAAPSRSASRRGSERRRPRGRGLLHGVHVYAGLGLSLLLFVLAVTGGALVYKDAYWRLVYPELRGPAPDASPRAQAAAVQAAMAAFGGEVRSVKMPAPGVAAYHLYLADGEAFLAVGDFRVIDRWGPTERVMPFLFELHAHLIAGDAGKKAVGVLGLLGVVMAGTGLALWWPVRRRFSLRSAVPRDLSMRSLLLWHRDVGALATPMLLLVMLTGSGVVFYDVSRTILNGLFGDAVPTAAAAGEAAADAPLAALDAATVQRAQAVFPDARIVFYYVPGEGAPVHRFRMQRPCELHPNGRTFVSLDASGAVTEALDACAQPPGERAAHAMYPLHAGKAGSSLYRLVVFLSALALAGLSLSGVVTYVRRVRRG